jgi:hypothetical protein
MEKSFTHMEVFNVVLLSLSGSFFLNNILSFIDGGEVYIWDLKAQDCIHKFFDDGCLKGTAVSVSR